MTRIEKYKNKLRALVLPSQVPLYNASLHDRLRLEALVKQLGVTPMLQFSYVSFAEQLLRIKNTHKGTTGVNEAVAVAEHWRLRGLSRSHLGTIATGMGFDGVPPPPAPERFGYDTPGGNGSGLTVDVLRGSRYACPKTGHAVSMSAYLGTFPFAPTRAKFAIYAVAGAAPGALLDETPEIAIPALPNQWFHADVIGGVALAAQNYFLIVFLEGQGLSVPTMYHDVIAAPAGRHVFPFNGFPNPMPGWASEGVKDFSVYCTYQPDD